LLLQLLPSRTRVPYTTLFRSDADGRRLYGNRATLDYFGCTVEEFRAPDFLRTVCHLDHFEKLQSDRQQFSRGEPFELETRVRSRSEEHTSELQSRVDLVCRLL